jgi:site-specific DNA-methyltransferase (adenine-specific)
MKVTNKIEITNEDNMALMARYPDKYFDLAIVDPPYGIGMDGGNVGYKGFNNFEKKGWDNTIPKDEYFLELFRVSKNQIVFGGNYFNLPPTRCFLVWDKGEGFYNRTYAECELAWTSFDKNTCKIKRDPLANGDYKGKIHPTQKPIQVYKWILDKYAKCPDCSGCGEVASNTIDCDVQTCKQCKGNIPKILDTHLGSGSIAIACHDYGFDLTACELDKEYFNNAIKRINNHVAQLKLI